MGIFALIIFGGSFITVCIIDRFGELWGIIPFICLVVSGVIYVDKFLGVKC